MKEIHLTGKQKRFLRGLGSTMDPIVQIGKGGIAEGAVQQADDALEARELIKVRVLNNCLEDSKDVSVELAEATHAALVQKIGHTFLLYRPSSKEQKIELPR